MMPPPLPYPPFLALLAAFLAAPLGPAIDRSVACFAAIEAFALEPLAFSLHRNDKRFLLLQRHALGVVEVVESVQGRGCCLGWSLSPLVAESTGLLEGVLIALLVPVLLHGLEHVADCLG